MRKVYHSEKSAAGLAVAVIASAGLTAVLFGFLPFGHQVAKPKSALEIMKVGAVELPPPVEEPPPPPPQPEQDKPPEQPPDPQLADAPQPISLSASLDVAVGSGGVLASMAAPFSASEVVAESAKDMAFFDVSELDKQPVLVASVSPVYPNDLRKARVEGNVVILFVLDESGRVEDPRVESSSRPEFEKPAMDALRKWKFKPGMKEGQPVRTYMRLPMKFKMSS